MVFATCFFNFKRIEVGLIKFELEVETGGGGVGWGAWGYNLTSGSFFFREN